MGLLSFMRKSKTEKSSQMLKCAKAGHGSIIGTRSYQQDAYRIDQTADGSKTIVVLCDGMGGLEGGELASNMVADYVLTELQKLVVDENHMGGIDDILASANELVKELKDEDGIPMRAGTTLVIAIVVDGKLDLVSVGDSSLYFYEAASGQMRRLTNDHNYLYMAEQMRDDKTFIYDPFQRGDALVSFIGAPEIKYVDRTTAPIELCKGDKILLCSDGLYNLLSDNEIKEILASDKTPQQIAEEEISVATENIISGQDNTTVVVLEMK